MPIGRLGVCSWSLEPETPRSLVESLKRVGVDCVQLALTPLVERPEVWGEVPKRLADAGITLLSGMLATVGEDYSSLATIASTGGVRPDATWPATLSRATRVAECAKRLGLPLVTFHAGFIPHRAGGHAPSRSEREVLIRRLRTIADVFDLHAIEVALETGQEEADTLADALGELRRETVGINFDPANMILYGMGEPVAALRHLAPRVRQVHVKDAVRTETPGTWGREVVAGTGEVDWDRFFDLLHAMPHTVDVVIEREAGTTRELDIVAAAELVRNQLARLAEVPAR